MTLPRARIEELEGILAHELEPGEDLDVRWQPKPRVRQPAGERRQRALRGRMKVAESRLARTSDPAVWALLLPLEALCLATHLGWYSHVGPVSVAQLQSGWLYLFLHLLAGVAFGLLTARPERRAYLRERDRLLAAAGEAGVSPEELVLLAAEGQTPRLGAQLTADHDLL